MLRRKRDLIRKAVCIALLFVVPILVSAPAVRQGNLPWDMDALTTRTPWLEARPAGLDGAEAAGFNPVTDRYYPWYAFISQAGARGELPLWNPYEGFGAPFLALWRTRTLSPFSLPLYVFQLHAAIGVSVFLKLLVAGLCAYYAARRFQFAPPYALIAALTFQMNGVLLTGHWHPASDVIPWFPLLLPCLQRMLFGDYRVWPQLSLLFAVMTLGGDPETLVGVVSFVVVLAFAYSMRTYTYRHLTGTLAAVAVCVFLGLMLAALQLAPFIEFTRYGYLEEPPRDFFHIRDLAVLLAPVWRSNSLDAAIWMPAGLVGFLLLPLWLAVRPFANRMRKRRLEALLVATLFILAFAMLCSAQLRRFATLSHIDVFHFSAPFSLAFGLLVATVADEWIHLDAQKCKKTLKKLAWYLPSLWIVAFLLAFIATRNAELHNISQTSLLFSALLAFVLLAVIIVTSFWPDARLAVCAFLFVTIAFSWWTYAPHELTTPEKFIFPETAFVRTLHNQNSRVTGSVRLKHWPLSPHEIAQTYSPAGVVMFRTQQFIRQVDERPELLRLSGAQALLLTKQDVKERFSSLRPVLNIQEVFPSGAILMKDLQAHDRVRVVYTGRLFDADKPQQVRASGPPLLEGGALPTSLNEPAASEAVIIRESANMITIIASISRPGVLVLADAWYPGWRTVTDGSVSPIFPVDIAFRGVEISEGAHEILFTYDPFSLRMGMYISLLALGILIVGFLAIFWNRRHA